MGDHKKENNEKMDDSHVKVEIKDADEKSEKKEAKSEEKPIEKMKKSELIEKINELSEKSTSNYELCLRAQAEMENIKKRSKKDKEDWIKFANEKLIKELLPVIDNLELALSHSHDQNPISALKEGVELTYKGLKDALAKAGLEDIKADGEPFDPTFHQAVSEVEDEEVESGNILTVLQKGYILNERLIRPSMVVVSKGKPGNASD